MQSLVAHLLEAYVPPRSAYWARIDDDREHRILRSPSRPLEELLMVGFRVRRALQMVAVCASALFVGVARAEAQTGRISGTVKDSTANFPVGGANVAIVGTTLGTATADDGRYVITGVQPGTYTVEARRLGYAPVRRAGVVVAAGQTVTVDFTVAVGGAAPSGNRHHRRRRSDGGHEGAVHRRPRDARRSCPFRRRTPSHPFKARSRASRSFLRRSRATASAFSFASPTSINKNNSPLYRRRRCDSLRRDSSSADLNSLDIESIEVVKGAAGASLYGSRAASGVIQIRTARGNGLALGQDAVHLPHRDGRQRDEPRRAIARSITTT